MRRLVEIEPEAVAALYRRGARVTEIAEQYECCTGVIYDRLRTAGIRATARAEIPTAELVRRYVEQQESSLSIAKSFSVAAATVRRHLRLAGVDLRDDRERSVLEVRPCPQSVTFRAYVLGLVWGDFSAEWATPRRQRIYVRSSTTHDAQRHLAEAVFGSFGPVRLGETTIRATLHPSFEFVFAKYGSSVPAFVSREPAAAAFAAGYVDAEGSFGIYEGRARFKVDSYDEAVIAWLDEWCSSIGVTCRRRLVATKGTERADGLAYNGDLWRLNVNDAASISRFAASLAPFVRHPHRRAMMEAATTNAVARLRAHDPSGTHP